MIIKRYILIITSDPDAEWKLDGNLGGGAGKLVGNSCGNLIDFFKANQEEKNSNQVSAQVSDQVSTGKVVRKSRRLPSEACWSGLTIMYESYIQYTIKNI